MKNFLIKYQAYNNQEQLIKSGEMRAKNKFNEFAAKAGLEEYFKKNLPGFTKLVVNSCREVSPIEEILKEHPLPKFK